MTLRKALLCLAVTAGILALWSAGSSASGISTSCGSIWLQNLKIGQQYSLRQLLGFPFNVSYRGTAMVDLQVKAVMFDRVDPYGCDYLPDLAWVKVEKERFSLDPGQTAETDVLITIPNDEKYMGKKYVFYMNPVSGPPADAKGGFVFGTGLMCPIRLEIAAKPPTPEEIRQLRKQLLGQVMTVSLTPERIFVDDTVPGKSYNLKKDYDETLKIVNTSDIEVQVTLENMKSQLAGMAPPGGYVEPDDVKWVKLGKTKLKLQPNSITEVPLTLVVPSSAKPGGKYFLLVCAHVKSAIRLSNYYMKVYVDMRAEEQPKNPPK